MKKNMQRNQHGRCAYDVIRSRYITEKTTVLQELQHRESNPSIKRCKSPKVVFLVHPNANKPEIIKALEEIYQERDIKVTKVNIVNVKPKKRRMRRHVGKTAAFKKAIVTLSAGDTIEEV